MKTPHGQRNATTMHPHYQTLHDTWSKISEIRATLSINSQFQSPSAEEWSRSVGEAWDRLVKSLDALSCPNCEKVGKEFYVLILKMGRARACCDSGCLKAFTKRTPPVVVNGISEMSQKIRDDFMVLQSEMFSANDAVMKSERIPPSGIPEAERALREMASFLK